MAPVNKIKTYGRSNKSITNSSVDAINVLFAKNRDKARRQKKRKLVVKELPRRARGETLLVDDSFHVSTEDTFDKLLKKDGYRSKTKSNGDAVKHEDSFSVSNIVYSPIMTRRRKRTASVIELSDNVSASKGKKFKGNQSCSIIPHFLEPTVDRIDGSLEIERDQKAAPKSISYIKLPDINEGEVSNFLIGENAGINRNKDTTYDPIFSKSFREKQMIHCSTPVMSLKSKERIINYTISPISNVSLKDKFVSRTKHLNVSSPKSVSVLCKSQSTNVDSSSKGSDWKLKKVPKVLLNDCADAVRKENRSHRFPASVDSIESNYFNLSPQATIDKSKIRESFITLRKRKILKNSISSKQKTNNRHTTADSSMGTSKNLTTSLADFNSFVDRINHTEHKKAHSLCDFESFVLQNRNLLGVNEHVEKQKTQTETPINFVTKRRGKLTDSDLQSIVPSETLPQTPKTTSNRSKHSDVLIKDLVVHLPKINVDLKSNMTGSLNDINHLIPLIDCGNAYLQSSIHKSNDNCDSSDKKGKTKKRKNETKPTPKNDKISSYQLRDLVVNVTNVKLDLKEKKSNEENKPNIQSIDLESYVDSVPLKLDKFDVISLDKSSLQESELISSNEDDLVNMNFKNELEELSKPGKFARSSKVCSETSVGAYSQKELSCFEFNKFHSRVDSKFPVDCPNSKITTYVSNSYNGANISEKDFEQFYLNMTDRSDCSKNASDIVKLPKISDPRGRVADFEAFERFFTEAAGGKEQLRPQSNESNSVISETYSENLGRVRSAKEFENFFMDVMRSTSESDSNKFVINDDQCSTDIPIDKIEKEIVINLVKSPWRRRSSLSRCQPRTSHTIVDLTTSKEENLPENSKLPTLPEVSHSVSDISDIIESSLPEPERVDRDGFRMPTVAGKQTRHSKTLMLKAGKLWRRSLSIYRRSSMILNLVNAGGCNSCNEHCACPKCILSRKSKCLSLRRCSIKIVPASPAVDRKEISILENYAHGTSYVSDQTIEDNLEDNLRGLSISKRRSSIIQNSAPVTARELVLRRCGQSEPIPFEQCYPKSLLQHCQKIGEGVYGEVFLFRNPDGGTSVMKVIPIEGDLIVNGERQKKFEEIFSEIIIAQELSNLRNNKQNTTTGFAEVQKVQCVQGQYPEKLLDLWELYDETRGSENDSPDVFGPDQLYIVFQLANAGQDMEAFIFNNSLQAYTMFQQISCTLAVAEEQLHFEHRDLHWGNVLLTSVDRNKKTSFRLAGKTYEVASKGVEVSIIDFTLSRIEYDGVVMFNDLSLDADLFTAEGDYQFEIYKLMQKKNGNNWQRFEPYTNILWLHYTLDKAITALRYKNVQSKMHKEYIGKLKLLKDDILNYESVKEFVLNHF